ncbi:MAG: IS66 family transposase [Planctomycetes bacterium]|nr:IS66 family transposase [Planctomycetota bacterium]
MGARHQIPVTKYPKYACENQPQCGVASPERPTGLVEGNRYDASIAAEIITNKYGYHLPVYRQQDQFVGSGWTPSRSTLLNILKASAFVLRPLCEHIKRTVLATDILGTDDTSVTLLVPRRENIPLTFFDFTVSRQRTGPDLVLENFQGKLMADCYAGYQGLELRTDGRILRGACAAHARRKVYEARDVYPKESSIVLAKFQQLYDIEDRGKSCSSGDRLALRQDESQAVWKALGQWLDSSAAKDIRPKSRFGQALGYLRNQWTALQLYLTDGRMPIDNNPFDGNNVEQLMKQVALGRKNWLFIGSTAAGDRAADFMTLVASAIRNDLDVWAYLKDVLDRLLAGETNYEPLRPDIWRQSHPEFIRQYRAPERRDQADRKQARRAARRKPPPA